MFFNNSTVAFFRGQTYLYCIAFDECEYAENTVCKTNRLSPHYYRIVNNLQNRHPSQYIRHATDIRRCRMIL